MLMVMMMNDDHNDTGFNIHNDPHFYADIDSHKCTITIWL